MTFGTPSQSKGHLEQKRSLAVVPTLDDTRGGGVGDDGGGRGPPGAGVASEAAGVRVF